MKHIHTFEDFVNESSHAERSMMIRADQKDQILDLLKKANISVTLTQPPAYGGDYEIEFRTPQHAQKAEEILSILDESRINEGDMTNYYDGFIVLDYKTKKTYKFKYVKGTSNVKVEDAAILKVMKDTGESRGNFAVNGFVKKGEWDKTDADVLESNTNEAQNLDYWKDYEADASGQAPKEASDKCATMPTVLKCIDTAIKDWNKESESGPISKADEKWIGNLAIEFYKKFGYINGNIVSAMISQESK